MIEKKQKDWHPYKPEPKRLQRCSHYWKKKLKELRGYLREFPWKSTRETKPGVRYG